MTGRLALQSLEEEDLVQIEDRLLLSYEKRDLIVTDENKRRKRLQIFENLKSLKAALRKEIEFQFKCNFCDYRARQLKVSIIYYNIEEKIKLYFTSIFKIISSFTQSKNLLSAKFVKRNFHKREISIHTKKFMRTIDATNVKNVARVKKSILKPPYKICNFIKFRIP